MSEAKEFRGQPPSEKAQKLAERAAELQKSKDMEAEKLRDIIVRLSNTNDGMEFFRWLKKECGYGAPYLALNQATGSIDPQLTVYQAMRLNLWWKVRKYLPIKQRVEVED